MGCSDNARKPFFTWAGHRLWDIETGLEKARLLGHDGDVNCVALWEGQQAPEGNAVGRTVIASGSDDKTVRCE